MLHHTLRGSIISLAQVIDVEMERRRLLEQSPIPSTNEEPVLFDTDEIPWWVWIARFHLPEVRQRAALVGLRAASGGCWLRY